uniref:Multidrug and toxin extrusion protein n=1 Tax=Periophthalmus magnuspinnatus TaxID=409849 RepID=A0A3B4B5V3_9GOBI
MMEDTPYEEPRGCWPRGWWSRLKRVKCPIPSEYKDEVVEMFKLAIPIILSQASTFVIGFVSTAFTGHLGKTQLASVALAIAVINVTGISVGAGLTLACDTLISQTFGSGNLKQVGVILQRGVLILLLACLPCAAILLNTEGILILFRQSRNVARLAQIYVNIFLPSLPATFMYLLQSRYLQNQGIIWPQLITGVIGNVVNAVMNYVFLFSLKLDVAGSGAANAICQYFMAIFLFIYIYVKGIYKSTWSGWSAECLQEWGPFMWLAIPSMLMLCLEWWVYEIGGFLAGIISESELAAQSAVYELVTLNYMIPLGIGATASVRVGSALGAGKIEQAKLSAKVPVVCGSVMMALRHYIGYIFTTDKEVLARVSVVMIVYIVASIGVIRGAGKQTFGAVCNFLGYYFIGLPVGASLMFAAKMGILGFWTGLCLSAFIQATIFITFLCKLDWQKASTEAQIRAGVHIKDEAELNKIGAEATVAEPVYENPDNSLQVQGQSNLTNTTEGKMLCTKQLIVRRGLTVVILLLIFSGGVVAQIFLDKKLT